MTLYPKLITDALATVTYAGTKKNLIESEMLADDVRIDGMKVSFTLVFPRETDPFLKSTLKAAEAAIHYHVSKDVEVALSYEELANALDTLIYKEETREKCIAEGLSQAEKFTWDKSCDTVMKIYKELN